MLCKSDLMGLSVFAWLGAMVFGVSLGLLDWNVIAIVTAFGVVGSFAGSRIAGLVDQEN